MFQSSVLTINTKIGIVLFDILCLIGSVGAALFIRDFEVSTFDVFLANVLGFIPVIVFALGAFFVSNLYEDDLFLLKHKTGYRLTLACIAVTLFAVTLFYTYPYAGITPKSILFLFIIFSFALIFLSRFLWTKVLSKTKNAQAVLVATSPESDDLYIHVNKYAHIPIQFSDLVPLETTGHFLDLHVEKNDFQYIIVNTKRSLGEDVQEKLYKFVMQGGYIIDEARLYEALFHKVPLSDANYRSFFEPISASKRLFILWKRSVDIFVALCLSVVAVPLIVIAAICIKINDGREVIITQTRLGRFGKRIRLYKLRTMTYGDTGKWIKDREKDADFENKITKIGRYLRKSRIDELPQLWNILKGDLSLIGPRPDLEGLVGKLEEAIPYYSLRYSVQPGLSGWAQINQHVQPQSIEETRDRLAYDLYYVKYRSIILDIYIGLKTIKTLLSQEGK